MPTNQPEPPTIQPQPQSEIKKAFAEASTRRFQPYHWVPPDWANLARVEAKLMLVSNATDSQGFTHSYGREAPRSFVLSRRGTKAEAEAGADPGAEADPKKRKWPSAFSDFTHVEPILSTPRSASAPNGKREFKGDEFERLAAKATEPDLADYVGELGRAVGPKSLGMQRLKLVFEWIVLKATILLNDINKALDDQPLAAFDGAKQPSTQQQKYETARENYIQFLRDLDDHEPETKPDKTNAILYENEKAFLDRKSGYGRTLKWVYIAPVIVDGRVEAARIIVHWNPHSSSGGVPIIH